MRKLVWIVLVLAIAGLAAAVTKPGPNDVEAALKDRFLDRLASTNPTAAGNGGSFALTLMCKADHDACYEIVRAGLDVDYADRKVYAAVRVAGFGREVSCYGVFGQFFCDDEIPVGKS